MPIVPIINASDIKVEANPVVKLKNVTVMLERLSAITISQYTTSSCINTDIERIKQMICRFCSICDEIVPSETDEKVSLRKCCPKCGTYLLYQCIKCKRVYRPYVSIFNHLGRKCGPTTRYCCSYCNYITTDKYNHQSHVRLHTDTEPVQCNTCGVRLKNIFVLKKHVLYCGKKPHLFCHSCNYKTSNKVNLYRHQRTHLSDRSSSTSSKANTSSTNDKHYKIISRYCKKCEEKVEFLGRRGKTVCPKCQSKLLFQCVKCGVEKAVYKNILYHVRDKCVTQARNCPRCDKLYSTIPKLQEHLRRCGKPEIACDYCSYQTTEKHHMKRHIQSKHMVETCPRFNPPVKYQIDNEDTEENVNNLPTSIIETVDVEYMKVEQDFRLSNFIDTSSEAQFGNIDDFTIIKHDAYMKEEFILGTID